MSEAKAPHQRGGYTEDVFAEELAEIGLRFEVDGEIATITLDRPDKRNAQTFATWSALARIGDILPEQVRVVVVNGEGPSFSAGIDLRMFTPEGVPGQGSFAPRRGSTTRRSRSCSSRPSRDSCGYAAQRSSPSRPCRDTRSARDFSSRSPVTCASWPTMSSSA